MQWVRYNLVGNYSFLLPIVCLRPYDGKWSKTMMGYGAEDDHFVVELTYNYGIKHYEKGNEFQVLLYCTFIRVKLAYKYSL